ncbi:MAG: signal peptidase I [Weeksellaceae bacterium]|nr:signal peptidase I [Weeksellaceae bacterium]
MEILLNWLIAIIIYNLIYGASTWQLYKIAGRKPLEAFIPFYNFWIGLELIQRPKWWIILFFTPIIAPIMWVVFWVDFARCFGRRTWTDAILMIVSIGLYSFYLNYIVKPDYEGPEERKSTFIAALVFAVVLATLVHTWFIQPMVVPTGSMENTIRIGDALFVEKLSYGVRVPITPIGIPFSEFINRNLFVDQARLPYMRIPGWRDLKANDIVVFNYPTDSAFTAIDRKDAYVKRLVGMPGDSLEFDESILKINGKEFIPKKDSWVQHAYLITTKIPFSSQVLYDDFSLLNGKDYKIEAQGNNQYTYLFRALTSSMVEQMRKNPNVLVVEQKISPKGIKDEHFYAGGRVDSTYTIFPLDKNWNQDNFGPLYIPKKGDKVKINENSITQYYNIIKIYEKNDLKIENGKIFINGKEANEYEIQQDYFFMSGDNRNESLDSRFFGYVPEDHIIGRPIWVWANFNGMFEPAPKKFIWERWMTSINNDNPDKTSYRYYALIALIAFFAWDYIRAKKKKTDKK